MIFMASFSKSRALIQLEFSLCASSFNTGIRIDQLIKLVQGQIGKSQTVAFSHDLIVKLIGSKQEDLLFPESRGILGIGFNPKNC